MKGISVYYETDLMKTNKTIALSLLLVLLMGTLLACTPAEKKLIGTWSNTSSTLGVVTETVYIFNEDGTGSSSTVLGIGIPFTYTFNQNQLTITRSVLGVESSEVYSVSFSGDKLIMSKNNERMELTRK